MIIIWIFHLPEDQVDLDLAMASRNNQNALDSIAEVFRRHRKYEGPAMTEELFYEILSDEEASCS
jgi:hypothetical protein